MRRTAISVALESALPNDARSAFQTLMTSMEAIENIVEEEKRQAGVVDELTTLACTVNKRYGEDQGIQDSFRDLVNQVLDKEGLATEVVSTEGLGSVLSSLFGGAKKPKTIPEKEEWTMAHRAQIDQFLRELAKTYGNSGWVKKQKLIEGTVAATDISPYFIVNNTLTTDPFSNIQVAIGATQRWAKAWRQVLEPIDKKVRAIEQRVHAGTRGLEIGDEKGLEIVRQAVKELEAISDPLPKLPTMGNLTSTRNMVIVVKGDATQAVPKMDLTVETAMPAAKEADILKAAELIKNLLVNYRQYDVGMLAAGGMPWLDFKDDSDFSSWIYESDYDLYDEFYGRFYYQRDPELWTNDLYELFNTYKTAVALIKWIDRSIK